MSQAVTPFLTAKRSSSIALQNTLSAVFLTGFDTSTARRNLSVQVTQVPSDGALYQTDRTSVPIVNGDYLLGKITKNRYQNGTKVLYQGSKYFFTSPSVTANGTAISQGPERIKFRVSAVDGSSSLESTHNLTVKNVNDPTEFDTSNMRSHPKVT